MTLDQIYDWEYQLRESVGPKQRFILLDKFLSHKDQFRTVLDAGGSSVTSVILRQIFPDVRIISANIGSESNTQADSSINIDLTDTTLIERAFKGTYFDLIFMGEVFEHLFRPYAGLEALIKTLKPGGYLIITTPNLANIYARASLLLGKSLHQYRPIGRVANEDHVTIVTRAEMVEVLHHLGLKVMSVKGYSYAEKRLGFEMESKGARSGLKLRRTRLLLDSILPLNFKEGLIYFAKKPTEPT